VDQAISDWPRRHHSRQRKCEPGMQRGIRTLYKWTFSDTGQVAQRRNLQIFQYRNSREVKYLFYCTTTTLSPDSLQESSSVDSDLELVHSVQSTPSLPEISLRRCKIDSDKPSDMSDSSVSVDETQPEIPRRIRGPADMLGNPMNVSLSGLEANDHRLNCGCRVTHSVPKPGPRPLKYPRHSGVAPLPSTLMAQSPETLPPVKLTLSKQDREQFLQGASPRIQALVNQPFGKENLLQCFKSEARFSHVLIPLRRSGFLCPTEWQALAQVSHEAGTFLQLIEELWEVDFAPLHGFRTDDFMADTEIDPNRTRMATAALICFDGDPAALVRWWGGPHVGAHRSQPEALECMKGKIPTDIHSELMRILVNGIPKRCNASASNENFEAFYQHGNHPSCALAPEKAYKALVKDAKQGFLLCLLTNVQSLSPLIVM